MVLISPPPPTTRYLVDVHKKIAVLVSIVRSNAARHHHSRIVIKTCVGHSQRLEDVLLGELRESLLGGAQHHHAQQEVVGVAVDVFGSGYVIESRLPHNQLENLIGIVEVGRIATGK